MTGVQTCALPILKELFIEEPILKIYIPSLLTVVKTDISDFILGIYLV